MTDDHINEIIKQKTNGLVGWVSIATFFFDKSVLQLDNTIKIIDPVYFRLAYTYFWTIDAIMSKRRVELTGMYTLLDDHPPTFDNIYDGNSKCPLFIRGYYNTSKHRINPVFLNMLRRLNGNNYPILDITLLNECESML